MIVLGVWSAAMTLAAPALRLVLRRRAARGKERPARIAERRGLTRTARPPGLLIWIHVASVGEAVSVMPVVAALAVEAQVLLTSGTVTSADLIAQRIAAAGLADRVRHQFVPLDVPAWAARFVAHWRPDGAAFVESELWPNLLAALARAAVPTVLVNARLSARSARAWARVPASAGAVLGRFAAVFPQSAADAARLAALGAPPMPPAANLKLAAPPLAADLAEWTRLAPLVAGRPVWLAASIHPEDEPIVRAAHQVLQRAHPDLLTLIAPRHPDRGPALATAFPGAPRRALGQPPPGPGSGPGSGAVWIIDTIGELGLVYRLAPVVYLGKALVPPGGGQNPLEPARLGCAIATGPHVANFAEPVQRLSAQGGLMTVTDAAALAIFVGRCWADPAAARAMGQAAASVATAEAALPQQIATTLLDLARRPR